MEHWERILSFLFSEKGHKYSIREISEKLVIRYDYINRIISKNFKSGLINREKLGRKFIYSINESNYIEYKTNESESFLIHIPKKMRKILDWSNKNTVDLVEIDNEYYLQ